MENRASTSGTMFTNYDIFLSFRGEDTRHGFTGHLYDALCRNGINTFIDDENLRTGETIRPQLLQSIEASKISIIVFSTNYAASTWCLDELVKILQCHRERNQLVFPVFYKVEPSDVRHQRNTYKEAMDAHEIRFGCHTQKVKEWKEALAETSNMKGFHLKQGYEFKFIQEIVSKALTHIPPRQLLIEDRMIGLQTRVVEENKKIEGIKLVQCEEDDWTDTAFVKMKQLRILILRNTNLSCGTIHLPKQLRLLDWRGYPSNSIPSDLKEIVAFSLRHSPLTLEKPFQNFGHLTYMNFSHCESITHFPNVSEAQCLRKLILNGCINLVRFDESVGFLPNLTYLRASKCIKLTKFLSRICLPSLEHLSFNWCRRLGLFPDIVGKMDKPLKICLKATAIQELPDSFVDLVGLHYLDLTSCEKLGYLPSCLFMLPNFVTLKVGGCPQLGGSFARFRESLSTNAECRPSLETLHFSHASLCDEDLHVIMLSFPNLEVLNVSLNNFVSIPACVQELSYLTSLDLSYCLNLQEIPKLPSSVRKVDLRHCDSLSASTTSMLWSQVREEIHKLQVVMPTSNTKIPKWWDDRTSWKHDPQDLNFWARGKFPVVALAFVFGEMNYQSVGLDLSIDSGDVNSTYQPSHNFRVAENHVLLCDLRLWFSDEEWKRLDAHVEHGNKWKTVKVRCVPDIIPVHWGVYVYKEETSMKDVQFQEWEAVNLSWTEPSVKKRLYSAEELYIASFSESLKTVVKNLKRLMAPREEQSFCLMQHDRDKDKDEAEDEDEDEEGESDMEA
ncbi:hypothetical protein Ahy_A03g016296 isoform C [Arachis hypogaea]|uniref:TIR domain-containing protein n=1 Tax=Arachis hypogaea TaxID=3818 RepID=A0A445E2T5_ARAHY|nr:hypothetical protein Ahy_A03g016296 isoform C [Arachis hypogaea]